MRMGWVIVVAWMMATGLGCATAMRGESQKIKFATDPEGATVKIGEATYATPVEVALKRKEVHAVEITMEGYQGVKFEMKAQWDGATLVGVALPGGSAMAATDRATGADLAFYSLPKIKLEKATGKSELKELFQYRGKLLSKEDYDKAIEEEDLERFLHRED